MHATISHSRFQLRATRRLSFRQHQVRLGFLSAHRRALLGANLERRLRTRRGLRSNLRRMRERGLVFDRSFSIQCHSRVVQSKLKEKLKRVLRFNCNFGSRCRIKGTAGEEIVGRVRERRRKGSRFLLEFECCSFFWGCSPQQASSRGANWRRVIYPEARKRVKTRRASVQAKMNLRCLTGE